MRVFIIKSLKIVWRLSPEWLRLFACSLFALGLPKARGIHPASTDPIWIAGFFQEPTGLGQGTRLLYKEMRDSGKTVYAVDIGRNFGLEDIFGDRLFSLENCPGASERGTILFHVNPPVFIPKLYFCRHFLKKKRIIGFWNWELERIPSSWRVCERLVDEVLCPTHFTANAVKRSFHKPVSMHPYQIQSNMQSHSRKFAEDGVVRVLSIFDLGSNFYRKNPVATIKAFKLAFGDSRQAELVLKIGSTARYPKEWEILREAIGNATNIRVLTQYLDAAELEGLYQQSDIYLSLHRSEGYGLTLHEAMLHGLELVATGWSGNMDFMKGPKCHPVNYRLVKVDDPSGVYRDNRLRWAEPYVVEVAETIKNLYKYSPVD